jgi:hypothetical protein
MDQAELSEEHEQLSQWMLFIGLPPQHLSTLISAGIHSLDAILSASEEILHFVSQSMKPVTRKKFYAAVRELQTLFPQSPTTQSTATPPIETIIAGWRCTTCQHFNGEATDACIVCGGMHKWIGNWNVHAQHDQSMAAQNNEHYYKDIQGHDIKSTYREFSPLSAELSTVSSITEDSMDDWRCLLCDRLNFATAIFCRHCGTQTQNDGKRIDFNMDLVVGPNNQQYFEDGFFEDLSAAQSQSQSGYTDGDLLYFSDEESEQIINIQEEGMIFDEILEEEEAEEGGIAYLLDASASSLGSTPSPHNPSKRRHRPPKPRAPPKPRPPPKPQPAAKPKGLDMAVIKRMFRKCRRCKQRVLYLANFCPSCGLPARLNHVAPTITNMAAKANALVPGPPISQPVVAANPTPLLRQGSDQSVNSIQSNASNTTVETKKKKKKKKKKDDCKVN